MPAKGQKKWLSDEQERVVRAAYAKGATWREAAFLAGITARLLASRLEDQIRDLRRGRGRGGRRGPPIDPTPEEIEERRRECDERRMRLKGGKLPDVIDLS